MPFISNSDQEEMKKTIKVIAKVFPTLDPEIITPGATTLRDKAKQHRITVVMSKEEFRTKVQKALPENKQDQQPKQNPSLVRRNTLSSYLYQKQSFIELESDINNGMENLIVEDLVEAASSINVDHIEKLLQETQPVAELRKWKRVKHDFYSTDEIIRFYQEEKYNNKR
jgi:hypothetical protein